MYTFQKWVEECGGIGEVAVRLGTTRAAVRRWANRKGWPKVETIEGIIKRSNGRLSFESILKSTRKIKTKK